MSIVGRWEAEYLFCEFKKSHCEWVVTIRRITNECHGPFRFKCTIIVRLWEELELLDMENTVKYTDCILVFFLIFHGLAPPPLQEYIKRNVGSVTRAGSRGDCTVLLRRSTLGQATFSYRATNSWNSTPSA